MAVKTKKSTSKRKAPAETKEVSHARKQMWAVVLFAAGILLGALTFIKGDKLWLALHNFLFGMFGWSAFFFAPLIIYTAVIATMDKPLSAIKNKIWQVLALIILISGAITIFGDTLPDTGSIALDTRILYEQGIDLDGGGVCAMLVAMPLIALFEKTGASIIVALAMFVFVMLVTGSTLIGLFRSAAKPVKGIEDAYAATVETRESKRQEKTPRTAPLPAAPVKPARFDIDVDISGDSDSKAETPPWDAEKPEAVPAEKVKDTDAEKSGLPVHPVMSEKPLPKDPFSGIESPVEYISPEEFSKPLPTASTPEADKGAPSRAHHLDDDIIKAEQNETDEIGGVIDRFLKSSELPPLSPSEIPIEPVPVEETPAKPEIPPAKNIGENWTYSKPPVNMLALPKLPSAGNVSEEMKQSAQTLVDTLKSFGVQTRITDICRGPAVTRYELQPSAGVKISKITGLSDDIALNLASAGIRIEAPIPNKAAVGIEVPNKVVSLVSIREIIDSHDFKTAASNLSVALGRDIAGNITLADIAKMPHILIAGSTGSGKSVCINSIIISILYKSSPEDVKLLMVDPKVVELGIYNGIPHLLVPVVTEPKKAAGALNWAVVEMLRRYKVFAEFSVRDHAGYNRLAKTNEELKPMPQIVIIIDELADLMMAAPNDVEDSICRLAQMARAAGMHLVIATQRPSVDVITGVIKANIPSRIAFAVSSQVDSRTILDMGGAEKLLGRGDMLFYPVGASKPQRVQGCFVTDSEVESVVEFIKAGEKAQYDQQIVDEIDSHVVAEKSTSKDSGGGFDSNDDEMLPAAIECVVEAGMASTSLLQRRLKLGYARAARIVDQLEEHGIVGPFEGSKPRQVLISKDRWLEMKLTRGD